MTAPPKLHAIELPADWRLEGRTLLLTTAQCASLRGRAAHALRRPVTPEQARVAASKRVYRLKCECGACPTCRSRLAQRKRRASAR
jgi:hypothetical protein